MNNQRARGRTPRRVVIAGDTRIERAESPCSTTRFAVLQGLSWGSGGETRTPNQRINSPLLCRLSYPGKAGKGTTALLHPLISKAFEPHIAIGPKEPRLSVKDETCSEQEIRCIDSGRVKSRAPFAAPRPRSPAGATTEPALARGPPPVEACLCSGADRCERCCSETTRESQLHRERRLDPRS